LKTNLPSAPTVVIKAEFSGKRLWKVAVQRTLRKNVPTDQVREKKIKAATFLTISFRNRSDFAKGHKLSRGVVS
jgi:hypothetical protein